MNMTSKIAAYIMNPPYNGSDRANKPWVRIVVDTIGNAAPGAEFLFIVPTHWRTHPGKKYKPVLDCLRTQLEYFEEHYVDSALFGIGEQVSWWIARKKQTPSDCTEIQKYIFWDKDNKKKIYRMEVYDGHPYFSIWKKAYQIVFESKQYFCVFLGCLLIVPVRGAISRWYRW